MPIGYMDSDSLIDTIKRIAMIPTSQSLFGDSDLLSMANEEIRMGVVPSVMQYHEEYFVKDSPSIALVASQSNYPIPYRAIGGKFRTIFYEDTNGSLFPMSRINPEDQASYQQNSSGNSYFYFYLKGNDVILVPSVGTNPTGSIKFSYYHRPNDLVDSSRAATITAISEGASTTVLTVDQVPSGFLTTAAMDVLQSRPGHKTISYDVYPTAVDSTLMTITFDNDDLDSTLMVGDTVCFAGECIIPQIPSDLHDMLAQRVALRVMEALNDDKGVKLSAMKLQEMEANTAKLVDHRAEGNFQKVNNFRGLLRGNSFKKRFWF